jgi:uncharacterized membrane protein
MLALLGTMVGALEALGLSVLWAFITAINLLIAGVGAFIAVIAALMPDLPAVPGPPDSGVLQWVGYIYPMGAMLAVLATFLTAWVAFLAIRIPLRWIKAL